MSNDTNKSGQFFEYILTHHRGLFATVVLLPISCLYSAYVFARNHLLFRLRSAPAHHEQRVRDVIRQIEVWRDEGAREQLCTARSGWQTMSEMVPKYKLSRRNIRIAMCDVLEIDETRRTVRVEPLASMGQVSRTLIARGWILPVVPELDDLTVGGLIMGFGVETSSHKYGLFQYICESFDIVTAEGKLLHCSATENSELFYLIPWSHGTLGFLVAAELKIIPAKQYVRLQYRPVHTLEGLCAGFARECRDTVHNEFVEALVYSRDTGVIMTGVFTDDPGPDGPINRIGRWYKPWFYKHVEGFLRGRRTAVEYLPLRDYLHRHTRGYFWPWRKLFPSATIPCSAGCWAGPCRRESNC